jgi:PmbA protein
MTESDTKGLSHAARLLSPDEQQDQLASVVERVLKNARTAGADQTEVGASASGGLAATVRFGEVETLERHRDRSIGVTVYFGQRKGSASTSDMSDTSLDATVKMACDFARYTAEDEFAGLADAELMATEFPDLDLWHPWKLEPDAAIDIATECEVAARESDSRITNSEGATVSSHAGVAVYGNSHGFIGRTRGTRHSISCAMVGGEGDGMQRDYWYTVGRTSEDLEDARAVGEHAAKRTVRRLDARRLSTRKAPVIFAAEIARGLLGHFVAAIRGGNLYRKASFLVDSLDKEVFPDFVSIREEPHRKRGLGSANYDAEGVGTREREVVVEGILQGYFLDSYAARKLGMTTTANAGTVHNLIVSSGEQGLTDLLARMKTGLLVTEVMGQGVNIINGDYSRGAAGFWVEDGEIAFPVDEITIAGNLRDMFLGIEAIGSDVDLRGNLQTGSVLIPDMTIAGE